MNAWTPIPLRWSEKAEAEAVCAFAALEQEPHHSAASPVEGAGVLTPLGAQSGFLSRLFGRLAAAIPQMAQSHK